MTELWTGYGIVLLVMFVGVMGNVIPGIPGTPLIPAGAVGHQLYFAGQGGVGWWWVAALAALLRATTMVPGPWTTTHC